MGLWTRLDAFDPAELSTLIEDRRAVRTSLMRTTLHLVSSDDLFALRPVLQPVLERGFATGSPFGRRIAAVDLEAVRAAGRVLLAERPRTVAELGPLLAERFGGFDPVSLAHAVRYLEPLVQVPPRGLWGRSGRAAFTTVEAWLDRRVPLAPASDDALERLVLRYLAAFGPASVMDVQAWSWLTKLRPVVEGLRPRLRTFRDEAGVELFDVPDAPRPDPDTPAPVRFLPEYDNLLVSHADRSRVTTPGYLERAFTRGSFLVDGFVLGAWRMGAAKGTTRPGSPAVIEVEPFEPLAAHHRTAVADEAARLAGFLRPNASIDVAIADA